MSEPSFVVNKIAYPVNISREMAIAHGIIEPTAEEKAEQERRMIEFRAKCRDAWYIYASASQALDNLTDPGVRAVLDLHGPDADGYAVTCRHCHDGGDMGDRVEWPCETTEAIAKAYGIELPTMTLYRGDRP